MRRPYAHVANESIYPLVWLSCFNLLPAWGRNFNQSGAVKQAKKISSFFCKLLQDKLNSGVARLTGTPKKETLKPFLLKTGSKVGGKMRSIAIRLDYFEVTQDMA